jgi:hypothetical protein
MQQSHRILVHAVELVPDNLKKLCDLVLGARAEWFELGFQLNISRTDLKIIEMECKNVNLRFAEMLSTWLKMIDPMPSWESLIAALEHASVQCGGLAKRIREDCNIPIATSLGGPCSKSNHRVGLTTLCGESFRNELNFVFRKFGKQ